MKINEIFYTIQGEGPKTGKISTFIRLAGCNLKCTFCDTKYTWLFSTKTLESLARKLPNHAMKDLGSVIYDKDKEIQDLEIDQIINKIRGFPSKNIVITGGEPLLQSDELVKLFMDPFFEDKEIEIETNGTLPPLHDISLNLSYNISPKLANSYNPLERRYNLPNLKKYRHLNAVLKFVVASINDMDEINSIIEQIDIPKERVYLMPMAVNANELAEKGPTVFNLSLNYGYSYSHRIHIQLFSEKRGI